MLKYLQVLRMKPFIETLDVSSAVLTQKQRAKAVKIKKIIEAVPTKVDPVSL